MEIYIIILVVLFALAISDLIVGVSNDAVNFLNSAVGSRVANFKWIMLIASLGIVVGATFSEGMMEVARKGIFNPDQFYFSEIIIIFLAVMITDVIILDLFNTLGFPTSTTVSIVFELLGAAVAVSVVKIIGNGAEMSELSNYINSDKALMIITGILLSVVIAFTVGALVQYLTRLLFSFNYKKSLKYFGSLFGGLAIASITYFILIKGAKGSSILNENMVEFIKENSFKLLLASFVVWTILLQILSWIFKKFNILKFIVLVGTFSLAMAFAGNDLVNFIGVPLAGFKSYQIFMEAPGAQPDSFLMIAMTGKVKTETYLLLAAGLIMVVTLITSKKAKKVLKTSLDLSRQNEGEERFGSSAFSRGIVRSARKFSNGAGVVVPATIRNAAAKRFQAVEEPVDDGVSFDLVRASVNLVVASILIAIGTSLKLPLSTTYVTFMVLMGTSLADKAWGRESAVYRLTGVFSIIGGWFLTAFVAFSAAFIVALLISWGGFIMIFVFVALAVFLVIRMHIYSKRKNKKESDEYGILEVKEELDSEDLSKASVQKIEGLLNRVNSLYGKVILALGNEDLVKLRKNMKECGSIKKETKALKQKVTKVINKLNAQDVEAPYHFVIVLDFLRQITYSTNYITTSAYEHLSNNHESINNVQFEELQELSVDVKEIIDRMLEDYSDSSFGNRDKMLVLQEKVLADVSKFRKNQIRRIKNEKTSTKNSILFFEILSETKNLVVFSYQLYKNQEEDFFLKK